MESLLASGVFDALTLGLAIIAVVQGIKKATNDSISGWVTILISALLGLIAGVAGTYLHYAHFQEIDPILGLIIGLAASGGITLVRSITNSQ